MLSKLLEEALTFFLVFAVQDLSATPPCAVFPAFPDGLAVVL